MIRESFGIDWGVLAAVLLGLVLFGVGFNWLTAWSERRGYIRGYTALFVVVGVAVTVAATAVISLPFALVTAAAFVASGTPMILGSMWRHMKEREQEVLRLRAKIQDGSDGDAQ